MNIIIIGPQASGKGTQAELIAQKYGLYHFSTGDVLRAEIKSGSELGKRIQADIDQGKLIDDSISYHLVKEAYTQHSQGLILDGYPRTVRQAELMKEDMIIDSVLEIHIHDNVAVKRISGRYVCSQCSHTYNLVSLPPRITGVCDFDGSKLVQRDDDKEEAVRRRLATYHEQTQLVIEYYRLQGVRVTRINGEQSIEAVFGDIINVLK